MPRTANRPNQPVESAGCQNQSNVGFLEHRGGGLVQQLATANLLEAIQQTFGLQALFLGAAQARVTGISKNVH